ncbi:DDT domain-containing protein DDR4 [Vitis vinifera]|uniref:DDT domain-containing protein DDR4 n=1 Tax=Vitis vinifera TaxID=29760 RepID=A0A438F1V2_VITVI|nr:DDT domain-containing protein DDR4 [Vitis vinifera]
MSGVRRRRDAAGKERRLVKTDNGEDPVILSDSLESETGSARIRLRERWELASVLNFLNVFEPVIGSNSKISAEEIEMGLIKPDSPVAQLHIDLLKGIPPVNKNLNGSDAWVTVLCKKLTMWWPWVAEGEIPLTANKGEEINRYKELDPTIRLQILKALCEIRAEQNDTVSYINDAIKHGTELSCFRKNNIGGDRNGTTYWYDGNTVLGHRLYREVKKFDPKTKVRGKGCLAPPLASFKWETLATNLEEFRKVADDFSSSKVTVQVAVSKIVQTDAIPVLEDLQKKKERALKRKRRQEMLLNDSQNSYRVESTRSCRNRRPVSYTFDEYDRTIKEAIQMTNKRKATEDQKCNGKHGNMNGIASDGDSDTDTDTDTQLRDSSVNSRDSMESDSGNVKPHEDDGDYEDKESDEYSIKKEDENDEVGNDDKNNQYYMKTKDDNEDGDDYKTDRTAEFNIKKEGDEFNIKEEEGSEDGNDCKDEKAYQNHMKEVENDDGRDLSSSHKKIFNLSKRNHATAQSKEQSCYSPSKPGGLRWSIRLAETSSHPVAGTRSPGTKNRLRQRPTRNTAMESIIIPDSEDGNSSENTNSGIPGGETSSPTADLEEESDC